MNFAHSTFSNAFFKEGIKNRKIMLRNPKTTICKQVFEILWLAQTLQGDLSLKGCYLRHFSGDSAQGLHGQGLPCHPGQTEPCLGQATLSLGVTGTAIECRGYQNWMDGCTCNFPTSRLLLLLVSQNGALMGFSH